MPTSVLDYLKKGEGSHHAMGPSSFPARDKCTQYRGTPVPEFDLENKANRGTLIHKCFEDILSKGSAPEVIIAELDDQEYQGLHWAIDWVKANVPAERKMESKVTCIDDSFNELYFGTVDLTWVDDGVLHIADLKTGNKRDYTMQLKGYAYPSMKAACVDKCVVHTLYTKFEACETLDCTLEDCENDVLSLIKRVKGGIEAPKPCDYCAWCKNQPTCPALADGAKKVVEGYGDSPFALDNYHSSQITDPKQMYKALWMAKKLEGWCKSVKKHAMDMYVNQGLPIPNTKIVNVKGRSSIKNVSKALEVSGMTEHEFLSACSVSLDALAKVEAKSMKITIKEAKQDLIARLAGVIVTSEPTKRVNLLEK